MFNLLIPYHTLYNLIQGDENPYFRIDLLIVNLSSTQWIRQCRINEINFIFCFVFGVGVNYAAYNITGKWIAKDFPRKKENVLSIRFDYQLQQPPSPHPPHTFTMIQN